METYQRIFRCCKRAYLLLYVHDSYKKACKKKFNEVKVIEKTLLLRVEVINVATKRVKFSLSDNAIDKRAIYDEEYKDDKLATFNNNKVKDSKSLEQEERSPTLEIVKSHERQSTRELRNDSFENIWLLMRGSHEIGLRISKKRLLL
jgi:hypothetical protein